MMDRPKPPPDQTLGLLVHDVARLLRRRFEQRAREAQLPLSRSQCAVLSRVARQEGLSQTKLAQCLDIEPIVLVHLLDRLEELGLIERRLNPKDRRVWLLYPRPAAKPVIEQIRALSALVREEAMAGMAESGCRALIDDLLHLKHNLSNGQAGAERGGSGTAMPLALAAADAGTNG